MSVTPPSIATASAPVLMLAGRPWHVWPARRSDGRPLDAGADEALERTAGDDGHGGA